MPYHLDTNIMIHARDGSPSVQGKLLAHPGEIFISALTLAELQRGLLKSIAESELRRKRLEVLLPAIPVVPFDIEAVRIYRRILERCGWVRGREFDRMIAAHAMSMGATLVTDNLADFKDIAGLKLENWLHG